MEKSFTQLKQYASDNTILNSIQIASIKAASGIDKNSASANVKEFISQILKNPESMTWIKTIGFYVVTNNPTIEWENFAEKSEGIEAVLVAKCTEAINKIGA